MAFAIEIIKIKEENDWVYYHYRSAKKDVDFGQIKISRLNGDVFLIENAEFDQSGAQATRAGWKLIEHWKRNEYPEKTYWES